jgi:dihydroorotase
MRKTLLRGMRLIDPATATDERIDLLLADGVIAARGVDIVADQETRIVEVPGAVVAPGLVDMHVHLREPGREDEETIESGTLAAVHGGITTLAAMPNTEPTIDTPSWVEYVRSRGRLARVHPIAAITVGREGKALAPLAELAQAGAVAFSDDGCSVADANVMRRALQYASMIERTIIAHCEDPALVGAGVMNEGLASTRSGLSPIPAAAEETMVARDILLAGSVGARLHIAHVSTRGSVELVRRAKADGIAVTAETCPHYFSLTDDDVRSYDTSTRVNPPLRSADDVEAVKEGLRDGTIDAVASDHAPHSLEEKQVEFDAAPPGMIGMEVLLPLTITHMVDTGVLSLGKAIALMTVQPARALGITAGTLETGAAADVVVFDPRAKVEITSDWFRSLSKNSPFIGSTLSGRVLITIHDGQIVFEEDLGTAQGSGEDHGKRAAESNELVVGV